MPTKMQSYIKGSLSKIGAWDLARDSLARIQPLLSPLMRPGIFFFHQGRCGSTVVANLLGQHTKISSYAEIFEWYEPNRWNPSPRNFENILRYYRTRSFPNYALVELKYYECGFLHVIGLNIGEFVDVVRRCGYHKFIILTRRNHLKRSISWKLESARRSFKKKGRGWNYEVNEEIPPISTIRLDVENVPVGISGCNARIVDQFNYVDEQTRKLKNELAGEDLLELNYEEDISDDPVAGYTKVCQWLGIESQPVQIKYRKVNPKEPHEVVENWDEVVLALAGTKYSWMVKLNQDAIKIMV